MTFIQTATSTCSYPALEPHANFSDASFDYIQQLISCVMRQSYFLEPTGTFKTLKGFAMGDCSAARGSEIILRVFELEIWKKICSRNLTFFLRFRDDVSIQISGFTQQIRYPTDLQFNIETNFL